MWLRKNITIGAVFLVIISMVIQAMFSDCVEAKTGSVDGSKYVVRPVKNNTQSNVNAQGLNKHKNDKSVYYIRQDSKHNNIIKYNKDQIRRKHIAAMDNSKWNFDKSNLTNEGKLQNSAESGQLVLRTEPHSFTKIQSKGTSSIPAGINNSGVIQHPLDSSSEITLMDNLRIVSKRETRGSTFNNVKGVHVDQPLYLNKTEIYGAYAEVYAEDDFSFAVGPEYSHSNEINIGSGDFESNSDLGIGLQLRLGF